MADAIVEEYTTSLDDLTFNSKPHINALTMLAEEYLPYAELIVGVIEAKLNKASSSGKLPIMYLMDSIVKNVGGNYTPLFAKNIVKSFYSTFEAGEDRVKMSLHKLRSTWDNYLPLKKLYELDVTIHANDPNWPVKPLPASLQDKPSSSIHVNPKFIKKTETAATTISGIATSLSTRKTSTNDSIDLKQDLINKQKQLLELQQQKLLLELEQTKQQLALKAKRDQVKRQGVGAPKDPRLKATASTLRVTLPNGQRQAPKDPRAAALSKAKPNLPTQTKKAPDPRVKSGELKKTVPESEKVKVIKKSPADSEKQPKKKKASPNNSVKATTKASKTPSPKITAKSDAGKKTKVIKKKTEVKAVKRLTEERKAESPKPEKNEREERQKALPREAPKKRERPVRRSPPRARPPPAKQPRRSTSVEKRRSPSPPRRISQPHRHPFPKSMREEELRRESPRAEDGSISPRFSPEPDDGPGRRQGWRPPPKRMRQQEPPAPWRHEEHNMMPAQPARRRSSVDPNLTIPQELTLSHQAEILKQAEVQLQSGQLTHTQHQDLLKQLHQLFELQRLRNFLQQGSLPGQQDDRPRMPLDELLPERRAPEMRHDRGDFRRGPIHRHDENQPPHFRPPPSPPMMDVDRDDGFRHPPRPRRLTPPPMPPSMDPRLNRNHPPPHMEDPRFQRSRDEFPPHPNEPGFRDDRGMPPRHEMDRGPPIMDRRSSPPQQRRGSASWNNQPPPRRPSYGEDFGNVFIVEEPERFQRQPRHDPGPSNGAQDLQNGTKPPMERVPLRAYAHPESENKERTQEGMKRRSSFEDRRRQRRSPPKKAEPDKHQPPQKKPPAGEQSEVEDEGPHLEEPEDYIIANIPPGAEAYHEHSMKLNAHKKSIIASQYTKKLAESNKEKDSKPSQKKPPPENLPAEAMSSPDVSRRDKLEEEVQKSPSLPLKKRKYLVSSSSDIRDSSDGGVATEPESEPPSAPPKETPPAAVEEEPEKKAEEPKKMEVDKIPEKVVEEEVQDQASHKADKEIKEPTEKQENKEMKEDTEKLENKEMKKDTKKQEKQEETQAEEKLDDKTKEKAENPPSEKTVVVKKEPEESLKEMKKAGGKKNKRRKKEKNRLQQRMQQLAEDGEKTMQDNGPRGKFGRRNDVAKMNEEERIHGLMMEEEERLRWEAELEMQLGREEFQERASHRGGRMNRSPPRRGWGRDEDGPWRGRGGPPNRRRGGPPGRGREIWDDGPPFRGRRRPGRMLPPRRGDGRPQWVQLRDEPHPGPGRGPMPNEERIPPLFPDLGRGNDGPPRPLFSPHGPPPPPTQPDMNQVNVNKLLSDLLNMGIIPGAVKKEPENPPTTQQSPNEVQQNPAGAIISSAQAVAAVTPSQSHEELASLPIMPKPNLSLETNRVPTPVFEELLTFDPDAKLPNVTLNDVEKLKIRHEEVVKRLYTGIQCSACGMRFTACQTDMYAEHLDWHYRLNRKDRDGVRETHRMLYPTAGEWIMYEEIVDPSQRAKNQVFEEEEENEMEAINEQEDSEDLVVPVAQNPEQDKCAVCNEAFKTVYNDEAEEWQYVNCVAVDDKNFHPSCYADHNDRDNGPLLTPVRVPLYNPLESSIRGIPGLDSLQEDTATDDYVPHNAAKSTPEVAATVGEEVTEERSEPSAKPDEGESAVQMDTAPAPETEAAPMEEEPVQDMPEPDKDVPAEMEGLAPNEQVIVKEERSPTPTADSISAPVQETEEQDESTEPTKNDTGESHDTMQEELQAPEEQSSTSESRPTTQEQQDDIIQHNMVKLERSQDSPTMLESVAQTEVENEHPFVTPGNVSDEISESPHVKYEQGSPTTDSFPPSEGAEISPDPQAENFAKTEAESDVDTAFPIPTLVSVPKIEPVENTMLIFEHDVSPSSMECGGDDDQPPPPGTEPMDGPDARSETDDESDLDYDDSDINVTL